MNDRNRSGTRSAPLAGVGAAALLVVCCVAGPGLVALAGGIGLAVLLGVGAGIIALGAIAATTVIGLRARRRRNRNPLASSHHR